jgi:hypothetical protein
MRRAYVLFSCLLAVFAAARPVSAAQPGETPRAYWGSVPCEIVIDRYRDVCRSEHKRLGVGENDILAPDDANRRGNTTPEPVNPEPAKTETAPPASIAKPAEPTRVGPRDLTPETTEAAHAAIDRLLARDLKDPLSARQYSVTPIIQCARMVPEKLADLKMPYCICYQVNAKNALGGYTGVDMGIASMVEVGSGYMALGYDSALWSKWAVQVCTSAGFQSRDAGLIHAAANQ